MGLVFEAHHQRMGRRVALKVIDSPLLKHPDALRRFDQEVKAAANLDHPNLARAYDADEFGSINVLVMEFIPGKSLDKVLAKEGPMSVARACDCIRQAAAGLGHANQQGMVHRDLKPQNLMLTPQGRVKILDFGLAKVTRQSPSRAGLTRETRSWARRTTCARASARCGQRRHPGRHLQPGLHALLPACRLAPLRWRHGDEGALGTSAAGGPPAVRSAPDVPRELSEVVARMLAKNPAERPQTPGEVEQALQPFVATGRAPLAPPAPARLIAEGTILPPTTVEIPLVDEPRPIKGTRTREPTSETTTVDIRAGVAEPAAERALARNCRAGSGRLLLRCLGH